MTTQEIRVSAALDTLTSVLLDERVPAGHWVGCLSSSALSTATAVVAHTLATRVTPHSRWHTLAQGGTDWLVRHQNADGGWGDTTVSVSNVSTTALCWGALSLEERATPVVEAARTRAQEWMRAAAGGLEPRVLVRTIAARYGRDRTFSVPILTVLALTGVFGTDRGAWRHVPQLPFELAAVPQRWYRWMRLPVVSYALPALIAIGQLRHTRRPSRNPVTRVLRQMLTGRTLRTLRAIQPASGGFLEAAPLTSFVVMSLIAAGRSTDPVVEAGLRFLERSVRPDGSWPIDTNLATWVTTLSVNALGCRPDWPATVDANSRAAIRSWLIGQQYRTRHPYTGADPGGWAWTDLPGGVPDADDTPGALLALLALGEPTPHLREAASAGVMWLIDLQNADGGMPTFCKGWGALPFDRSSPDLTAHALRAWTAWREWLPAPEQRRIDEAVTRAVRYLRRTQRFDGAWHPLWFGNQHAPDDVNAVYGTARVLQGLVCLGPPVAVPAAEQLAVMWLLNAQHPDGGWGGAPGVTPSIEESALAVAALATYQGVRRDDLDPSVAEAVTRGAGWLTHALERGHVDRPTPIGFYFAKLWYFERLYPRIFVLEALARVVTNGALSNGTQPDADETLAARTRKTS